jgi:hypothetical protein
MLEKEIQRQIIDYLDIQENLGKLYYFRSGSGAVSTIRQNGSKGFFKTGKAGCPDITICLPNSIFVGVEVKTKVGKLSPVQIQTKDKLIRLNAYYLLVRSVKELIQDIQYIEEIQTKLKK